MKRSIYLIFIITLIVILLGWNAKAENSKKQIYKYVREWGTEGSEDGQFKLPHGVAVDKLGNVYVADGGNERIQVFDIHGKFCWKISDMAFPYAIAIDKEENIYVSALYLYRICLDPKEDLVRILGEYSIDGENQSVGKGVEVDAEGNIYLVDSQNSCIRKLTPEGKLLTKWGEPGEGDGQFRYPSGIAIDSSGYVYVTDTLNNRVEKFDSNGKFVTKWGTSGDGDSQFNWTGGIAIDSKDDVYVTDVNNFRVQKFDSQGNFITKWGMKGFHKGELYKPNGIAVDKEGYVYVADTGNHRIQKFSPQTSGN